MTPEQWQQINDVLEAVDTAPVASPTDLLDRLCADAPAFRREVQSYLADAGEGAEMSIQHDPVHWCKS